MSPTPPKNAIRKPPKTPGTHGRLTLSDITDEEGRPLCICTTPEGLWLWWQGMHDKSWWTWRELIQKPVKRRESDRKAEADDLRWGRYLLEMRRNAGLSHRELAMKMLEAGVKLEVRWVRKANGQLKRWSEGLVTRLVTLALRAEAEAPAGSPAPPSPAGTGPATAPSSGGAAAP